jgi:phosphinothricin acetyltransferase
MEIRDAAESDLPGVLAIHNALVRDGAAVWTDRLSDLADRRAWWQDRVAQGWPVLVAAEGAAVPGYASFAAWRAREGYRATVEHSVHIAAAARGRGVGRALMAPLIARARALGLHAMVGAVEAGNVASLAFHARLGFRVVGTHRQVGQKFGRWLDLTWVELVLDDRAMP